MKQVKKLTILIAAFINIHATANAQHSLTPRQKRNLIAFAKVYGYVQYFYPSDEAQKVSWSRVAVRGCRDMLLIKNDNDLVSRLNFFYKTIAPDIEIFQTKDFNPSSSITNIPQDTLRKYNKTISWQHKGLYVYYERGNGFSNVRLNRKPQFPQAADTISSIKNAEPLYTERLKFGEKITREIVPGIKCIMPIALLGDSLHTYPIGSNAEFEKLSSSLIFGDKYRAVDIIKFPEIRLANIVMIWNVLKHSFAYWDDASLSPQTLLEKSLNDAYQSYTPLGFYKMLQRMGAALNDGHVFISPPFADPDSLSFPLYFRKVENKIVVSQVTDSTLATKISSGDIISKIDGVDIETLLKNKASLISGSPQNKEYRALVRLGNGSNQTGKISLLHYGRKVDVELKRSVQAEGWQPGYFLFKQVPNGWLKPNLYYFNLANTSFNSAIYPTLTKANSIIFDLRGYPVDDEVYNLVDMLLSEKQKIKRFYGLKILKPDMEDLLLESPEEEFTPSENMHLSAKVFFLTDASAQSASESFLGIIKDLKLGTIIGSATSGANGNMNNIQVLGNYGFSFSGLIVKNSDGSKAHGIGIKPDIYVESTIESVRLQKDLRLEKAITLAE